MTVFCAASLVSSCVKAGKEKEPTAQPETEFTVSLNTVEADYAEVVVRHTGAKDVTWFGFVTDDVTTSEQDLINAQVAHLDKKSLHVGNAQTVAVRNLSETSNYRYIAFAVKDGKEVFGKPGSVSFSTSPNLKVTFTAEATEVYNHHKIPYVEVRITNQHGDLCCVVTGLAYRKDATLPVEGLM